MTNECAREIINLVLSDNNNINVRQALGKIDNLICRSERYKWHNIQKNPEDLPEFNGNEVEVMFLTEHGFYNIGYYGENGHYRDKYFRHSRDGYEGYGTHCVVAWRYIEPFDEVQE